MRRDSGGAYDDCKLTGFACYGPSVSDWIASRLAEGPTGIVACGVDYIDLVSSPRSHCEIIPYH
jgi:hypothetical protein